MNGLGDAHVVLFYCRACRGPEREVQISVWSGLGTDGRVSGFMTGQRRHPSGRLNPSRACITEEQYSIGTPRTFTVVSS